MSTEHARVVVITGEALIDLVVAPDRRIDGHPGGGPYNVARTIGRLGQPVAYLGRISTDGFGRRLRQELEDDGVSTGAVIATDAPTALAMAELGAAGAAHYHFYAAHTSAPVTAARDLLARDDAVALITLGGAGAMVVTATEAIEVRSPPVEVVDTIGAGDAFIGAFLAQWRSRGLGRADLGRLDEVERAATFAARVASLTCTRAGADAPRPAELEP
jgi:sugar/nucleoside kinase (ribokinase family)